MLHFFKDVFTFTERQENAIFGSGCKITLQSYSDNHVLSNRAKIEAATLALAGRVSSDDISWLVQH